MKVVTRGYRQHGRRIVYFEDGTRTTQARLIAAVKIGRALRPDEQAHHVNGDKSDDRFENLEVLTASEHSRLHACGQTEPLRFCSGCGCATEDRSPGCQRCNRRHWKWMKDGQPYKPCVCAGCGGSLDDRTPGCNACRMRMYFRGRRERAAA